MTILRTASISSRRRDPWRVSLTALAGLGLLPAPSAARTWNVYEDGSGDARTIQIAMTKASAGDTVLVWPGTYPDSIRVASDVSLISQAGPATTILDAGGARAAIDAGQTAPVTGVLVQGFTITGARNGAFTDVGRTIFVDGDAVVRDCVVTGNIAVVAGAHLRQGDLRIYDTVFVDNFGTSSGGDWVAGVSCVDGYLVIERCTFDALTTGLSLRIEGGYVEFRDNVVRDTDHTIEVLAGATFVLFYDSLFDRVPFPISVEGGPSVIVRRNTFVRAGPNVAALGPAVGENTTIDRNVLTGARWGLWICSTCSGTAVTCNDSWGNAFDWLGRGDLDGVDGNFSLDPKFCNPSADDFTVAEDSPLVGVNNPCGKQVGAFGAGCPPNPVEASSWGMIKSHFR